MISSIFKSTGVGSTVQTSEVDDDAITTAKIADDAVTAAKIDGAPSNSYTQTYSTANRTVANAGATVLTLTNMTDGSANNTLEDIGNTSSSNQSAAIEKNFDKVGDEVNSLIADVDELRQTVTAVIDDLQALGLVG